MVRVGFRVDGGTEVGTGHVMRCIALGSHLSKEAKVIFITRKEESTIKILEQHGFQVVELNPREDVRTEIKAVQETIKQQKIEILITDSYQIKQNYLKQMRKVVSKLVSIHDFAPFAFPSHLVINGNIYALQLNYESLYGDTDFLLGTDYTLMRKEFENIQERKINEQVKSILITMGGSDRLNLTPKVLRTLSRLEKGDIEKKCLDLDRLHLDVVIGPAFDNLPAINREINNCPFEVCVHHNLQRMSRLMIKSDLAITAGGSTLYELATTGTPALTLLQADNQVLAAGQMAEKGAIQNLGFGDRVSEEQFLQKLKAVIEDYQLRVKMSGVGQALVDGKGVERCTEYILQC